MPIRLFACVGLMCFLCFCISCGGGNQVSQTQSPTQPSAPVINTATLADGAVNSPYNVTLSVSGGVSPYSWSIISGAVPPGLVLNGSTGAITGTPTASGTASFTVEVQDSQATKARAQASLSLQINPALSIVGTFSSAEVNAPYSATLSVHGGSAYAWSIISGMLPAGLALNSSTGVIAGTPTTAGKSSFSVQAQDSQNMNISGQASFNIAISPGLSITAPPLPASGQGVPYRAVFSASGGFPPYTWSLVSGDLPAGLNLSSEGVISGTPTAAGTFNFTVQAADLYPATISDPLMLKIVATPLGAVTTAHNDVLRTGQDVNETKLNPNNVNVSSFGKLFSYPVDGYLYAQPLYLPNVSIPGGGVHNLVLVATEHDSVYAFDADSNAGGNGNPLWQTTFIDPSQGITTVSSQDVNCDAIVPEIGITSTPVIDVSTNTIYVLAETKENGAFFHRLHALDLTTGAEQTGSPVTITAQVPGSGVGSSGGVITFDPLMQLNRPGLLLSDGTVYIAWGSNCDNPPFHGWVMGYDRSTLTQTSVWATTANGELGGIWMSGAGIGADASGNLFVPTGNGTFDTSGTPVDFGDSIVKIASGGSSFAPSDYFTPYDEGSLEAGDIDLGSGGALLLPDQPGAHVHEVIQVGKEGTLYLVDRDNMGHFNANNNSQIVQSITGELQAVLSSPAYWNGNVYIGGIQDALKAYSLTDGLLSLTPTSETGVTFTYLGPSPSVSANGSTNGIVWALFTDSNLNDGNEVLYAFDATNLGVELYDSNQNSMRDLVGGAVKFATPTIANGKVYAGAAQQLSVFGNIQPPVTSHK